ncbi:hypothetical protein GCM10017608_14830 [Agromyces luteolus]|nr:hypothetical protein GCM10017608_14830 [Agromyces luteolus]
MILRECKRGVRTRDAASSGLGPRPESHRQVCIQADATDIRRAADIAEGGIETEENPRSDGSVIAGSGSWPAGHDDGTRTPAMRAPSVVSRYELKASFTFSPACLRLAAA